MDLKRYQQDGLGRLEKFLFAARTTNVESAFFTHQERRDRQPYNPVPGLESAIFVCLKVPTGGGKTRMAAESIAIAARSIDCVHPVVLWLVPSRTIRDQTLAALRAPKGPLRRAIERDLGQATILNNEEALQSQKSVYDGGPVVIVTTLQSVRVDKTEGRKFYESNTNVLEHFEGLPPEALAGLETYDGSDKPISSLANALRLRRPIVIIDEAHNARTPLAFSTFARFNPSLIFEFTATPKPLGKKATDPPASNVLVDIGAYALKAESMIKLPVQVRSVPLWNDALNDALTKREQLEQMAAEEIDHPPLRPILLVQCERKDQELTITHLLDKLAELQIPREQIAVATGDIDELPKDIVNSHIKIVLTVDKLREGWDCPSAYVLLALRDLKSGTAIEQTLGRVLRQPGAVRRPTEALNRAYVYARGDKFSAGAATSAVVQALQASGFDPDSAKRAVDTPQPVLGDEFGGLFADPSAPPAPSVLGVRFAVPQLTFEFDGVREPATSDHFNATIDLHNVDFSLPDYDPHAETAATEVDVGKSRTLIQRTLAEVSRQLQLIAVDPTPSIARVVRWLDIGIPHPQVDIRQSLYFLQRVIEGLQATHRLTLDQIWADRLRIRESAKARLLEEVKHQFQVAAQGFLFDPPDEGLLVDENFPHVFPATFEPPRLYKGSLTFDKHYYPNVGDMNEAEANFANLLDARDEVEFWVRNVERVPGAFWLPTSTDKFYPDFVTKLRDDRFVIYEYKGDHLLESSDTQEKIKIGQVYAERSSGKCAFHLVDEKHAKAIVRESVKGFST